MEYDVETQTQRLGKATRSARQFNGMEEALEYAREKYDLGEDRVAAHEHLKEAIENFPPVTAEEIEMWAVFDALMKTGRVTLCPAKLDDERAVAIIQVTYGPGEIRITPLAILATEELRDRLELPYDN